ncbi:MAG: universal stress protein [Bacteroidota bacterium]|nr:universal stress protein [Bacteroidota bacterium]
MKKILVPTDFSVHAEYALKTAAQIARRNNGEIVLLHMLELPSQVVDQVSGRGVQIPEVMFFIQKTREKFEEIKQSSFLEGIPVTEAVQFEKAFDGILKASKAHDIDFVVMGSHGVSGVQGFFVGSNTEKVVRTSDVPVLVVKDDLKIKDINRFVFASDFSEEIRKPFEKAVSFAKAFGTHLDLLMINTPSNFKSTEETETTMTEFLKGFSLDNYSLHVYNDYSVEKGVLAFANRVNADLIGVSTHGRTGISHFLNGSIGEDIVNSATHPVITFKI